MPITFQMKPSPYGCCAMTFPVQDNYGQILGTHKYLGTKNYEIQRKYNIMANVIAQHPEQLLRFQRCHFEDNGQSYIFLKYTLCLVVVLDEVEVKT